MRKIFNCFVAMALLGCISFSCSKDNDDSTSSNMIIDHKCIDLSKIPEDAINKAAADLYIVYNRSWWHGYEISYGLRELSGFKGSMFRINENGRDNSLRFDDEHPFGEVRNIESEDTAFYKATRDTLKVNTKINVVMWCWENGVTEAKSADISTYLDLMSKLEKEFPKVKFVYMTGHLDGSTKTDNLYLRNEQIRKYCRDNNKILFDFADIESYDPDGNYFGDKLADDKCNYDSNGNGKIDDNDKNWAEDWQESHSKRWYDCGPDETPSLNSNLKAYAAWWMFARIAGWNGSSK